MRKYCRIYCVKAPRGFIPHRFQTGSANQTSFLPSDLKTIRIEEKKEVFKY
jgi:hypothetical protein